MDFAENVSDPLGSVLVVAGVFLAFRMAKRALKLVFLGVVLVGLYLWFGVDAQTGFGWPEFLK